MFLRQNFVLHHEEEIDDEAEYSDEERDNGEAKPFVPRLIHFMVHIQ
jgi:hypothetical protein